MNVWGPRGDALFAVGGRPDEGRVYRYDGRAWRDVAIPPLKRASVGAFYKVWGLHADNVYVVGQRGVVLHRTGGARREELAGASGDLVSVWGTDAAHVLAVGGTLGSNAGPFFGVALRRPLSATE